MESDLFRAAERIDASLNLDHAVRKALTAALKKSDKSREQVADDMTRLLGQKVSVGMLNHFTAETMPGHRFPAAWLAAFCVSVRDLGIVQVIAEHLGCRLVTSDEMMLIEYARAVLARKKAAEKIESLEVKLARRSSSVD